MPLLAKNREPMARAALDLLESLDAGQRPRARLAFDDGARHDWHYTPRSRPGLALKELSGEQRRLVFDLLRSALSAQGLGKVEGVLQIEQILGELSGNPSFRDPENYAVVVFGDPAGERPWAWRFEGHHLSLSFTVAPGIGVAATPAFFGANPAEVPAGHAHAGLRILGEEHRLAFALMAALDDMGRGAATIRARSFGDILTGPGREDSLREPQGLALSAMAQGPRDLAIKLVESYLGNMRAEVAAREMQKLKEAGLERLRFAWAGATEPGGPHYYRLHGPSALIEYDNTRNNANHVHSVWHDPRNLFGADLLRQHHERDHS